MIRTIISHDTDTAVAVIRFEHNSVTVEDTFQLIHVVPGTISVFAEMGIAFDESHQNTAIDRLTETIERQIDLGMIRNAPEVSSNGD